MAGDLAQINQLLLDVVEALGQPVRSLLQRTPSNLAACSHLVPRPV